MPNKRLCLGHKIAGGKIMMENVKVKVILDWEPPSKVPELRSFLRLVNYYRHFIKGYSAKVAPLTEIERGIGPKNANAHSRS